MAKKITVGYVIFGLFKTIFYGIALVVFCALIDIKFFDAEILNSKFAPLIFGLIIVISVKTGFPKFGKRYKRLRKGKKKRRKRRRK